jgi:glutamine synthetase
MHACDYLLASDMEMTPVAGYSYTSWEKGYGDFRLKPDLSTLRVASWLERSAIVLCDTHESESERLVPFAPRTILRSQLDRLLAAGFIPVGATELEFFLFNDSYESASKKSYDGLETAGSYIEDYHILQGTKEEDIVGAIRSHLERSGIPVENSKGEWGPGQQELNIRYDGLLAMSDNHVLFKNAAKEIAWQKGKSVTFMSKWNSSLAGSSMHIHLSLRDASGKRAVFPGRTKLGPLHVSDTFRWFLGGWMHRVREMYPFFAPYPVSYKRFVAGSFAPTAIAWSYDNRTAGFRIVGEGNSLRIECRMPGADANPYLAFAASIAAGLEGIQNKTEPPPMFEGDLYAARTMPQVPKTLREAIDTLDKSQWARTVLGKEVVEHYLHFFRTEQQKFDEAVTTWELARYFERA